jgi:DHA2 family methylenomycin A resistance protein-like MFS transporter
VFTVNVPLGLLAMLLTARRVPVVPPDPERPVNVVGQLTGVVALGGLSYALIDGGHRGPTPDVLAAAVVCLLSCLLAGLSAGRSPGRLGRTGRTRQVVPGLARRSGFAVGTAVGFLLNLGFYGELYVLNLYFQQSWHCPPLLAGLALLPQMGVVALGSALSGRHTARVGGPRRTMLIGLMVGGLGLLGLAPGLTGWPYPLLLVPLMAAGFGMSFTMPAVTTAVVDAAPAEQAGQAAGVINTARQVGSLVGVALLGALAAGPIGGPVHGLSRPPDQSVSGPLNGSENGPAAAMLAAAASFLLAWALVWLAPGNRRHSGTPVCRHGTRRADHDRN